MTGLGRLEGKVAVVTGASQGIGREIALAFAREGAQVVGGARNAEKLAETAALSDGRVVPCACDVSRSDDLRRLVATATERFGALHVMVNNAAMLRSRPFEEISEEEWDETMAVNVKGVFLGCKHAVPEIVKAGGGAIVNIGSVNSVVGEHLNTSYVTSKGAVLMLSKNLAAEYAARGVRVNVICPGAVDTSMELDYFDAMGGREAGLELMRTYQPLTGMIPPQDIASVAVFLASEDSRSMTGAAVVVDGGLTASWDHDPWSDPDADADAG